MTREVLTWTNPRPGYWSLVGPKSGEVCWVERDTEFKTRRAYRGYCRLKLYHGKPWWSLSGTVQGARNAAERHLASTWHADDFTIARKPQPLPPSTYTATVTRARTRKGVTHLSLVIDNGTHPIRAAISPK